MYPFTIPLWPEDDDTASTSSAVSDAPSLEHLTEVEPRTFMDIIDDAIPDYTNYRSPKSPLCDGTSNTFHGVRFGAEALPERVVKQHKYLRHSHSAVFRSFTADMERDIAYARKLRLGEHRRRRRAYSVQQDANRPFIEGTPEVTPSHEAQCDVNIRKCAKIGIFTVEEMWPDLLETFEDGAGKDTDGKELPRPKKGLYSKFKKFIKPHGDNFIRSIHTKDEWASEAENARSGRREKDDNQNQRAGINLLAHTMGFGMGRF
ncbi:uncharacterized protein CC84DRAFT_1176090 [Paraphaeosphaeria sporulosa]|uniref:Uncharacterized protein n=1 Tax=Paraphaeosphaeria sporulosa TaxID=1460663 RepID=A0A177CFL4_9PLEO|nr:uncharacterized protein CC84DRAFT_1176090 [Paraphaeosphaeria sporulosa]OAG06011.1 hypothetical protein CC84DRAFT_1176090 [Paraphaeosphaeria sporulosa]